MKVASPVGEFPYTIERVSLERRALVVHGRMGAWPSRIEVQPADLRVLRKPLLGLGAAALLLALRRAR